MKNNKEVRISYWAAHLTTVVSVTLVLLIIGIIALITVSAASETRRLRERLEVSVVMADTVSNARAEALAKEIEKSPYALSVGVVSKEAALKIWKADTGEDLEALFGVNPLSPEVAFTVKSGYSSEDSLRVIEKRISGFEGVAGVALPDSAMVESMNRNIERFSIVLGVIALVMVIISFVLINNTVHLAIYARRFTIHTMQLVGATSGFIRSPFVKSNMLSGLLAGLVASAIMAVALVAAPGAGFDNVADYISWPVYGVVAAGMIAVGVLLCGMAAWMATSRYLDKDYGELFR
ncbi:MAG: permease-like cell division protein FtsX [Muribaculaceae bacterium]